MKALAISMKCALLIATFLLLTALAIYFYQPSARKVEVFHYNFAVPEYRDGYVYVSGLEDYPSLAGMTVRQLDSVFSQYARHLILTKTVREFYAADWRVIYIWNSLEEWQLEDIPLIKDCYWIFPDSMDGFLNVKHPQVSISFAEGGEGKIPLHAAIYDTCFFDIYRDYLWFE